MSSKTPFTPSDESLRNKKINDAVQVQPKALQHYVHAATANNTRKAYRSAIRQFEKWGGRLPTDPSTVSRYLLERASALNPRTLDLHLMALSQWHHYQGLIDPTRDSQVRKVMEGIRRVHGKPKKKAKALRLEHIAAMVQYLHELPDSLKKQRDIALLLVGFFGAFRRSELAAIEVHHLSWEPEGLIILLPHSKTDQQAEGQYRALPFGSDAVCPATAIKKWLALSAITEGPIFRPINRWGQLTPKPLNPAAINILLKKLGQACEFDFVPELSSHSFRRGLSTSAARERVDFELIKKQGGWKSDTTVWEYIEEGQQFSQNAALILINKMAALLKKENY